ncbi:MAG: glycosyl transferase group 1, partial [Daejeonella sp.]|nr:glycosyl transferase group 1 [Daejeonella sp.]
KSILHDLEKIQKVVKKIFIVNNGIPIINYPYTKMVDENFNITCLSTITPLKQQLILLKAISILKSRGYQNLRCKIAGQISNQPYYHLLKKYVSENSLDHQVDFLGAIWGDDKNNLLRDTDVFVFPTSWESFGLVVLEAFNFKIPVIGSNIGSIPEIIDNGINGFIIDPGNFEGIADKLEYLILNPEKREIMGNNGYIKLCENYSLERFISTLNTTFDEILNDSF